MIKITKQFSDEKFKYLNKKHQKIITKHRLLSNKENAIIFLTAVVINIVFAATLIIFF